MLIVLTGLASYVLGRGSPAHLFLKILLVCAGLPLPTREQAYKADVVYDGTRPDQRQDQADMKKAIPSLYPSWLFS